MTSNLINLSQNTNLVFYKNGIIILYSESTLIHIEGPFLLVHEIETRIMWGNLFFKPILGTVMR